MGKAVKCSIEGFDGVITFKEPLTFALVAELEEVIASTALRPCSVALSMLKDIWKLPKEERDFTDYLNHVNECVNKDSDPHCRKELSKAQAFAKLEPVLLRCVEAWDVNGKTEIPKNLPASPKVIAFAFADFILTEVKKILDGDTNEQETIDPNL